MSRIHPQVPPPPEDSWRNIGVNSSGGDGCSSATDSASDCSEMYEKVYEVPPPPPVYKPSNLEMNCNQIFVKGPALTKDILEKMQRADIVPRSTFLFGYELKTRRFWVSAGLFLLFTLSIIGTVIMWSTSMFDNAVFTNLMLTNNSQALAMWRKPSPKPLLKWYMFNYTNVPEYERGDDPKLNVQELGPYVYEESLERINLKFNDSKISYQEQRSYRFRSDLSTGRKQNDRLIVPNVPLFAVAAAVKNLNFFERLGASLSLKGLHAKPFLSLPAHRFITGYEDTLYTVVRSLLKLQNQQPYENFGLVAGKIGVQPDVFTIDSGMHDINRIGVIETFNDKHKLDYWSTDECNSFAKATDGSIFPPKSIRGKEPVQFFLKEICRPLPLHYNRTVKILNGKIPAYRYAMSSNVFDEPERTAGNQCYCNMDAAGVCPPQGVFNTTPCSFGAPAFLSFPHFYNGDPALMDGVTGLNRHPQLHETYFDLHPTMGFTMGGKFRLQFNVQVAKSYGVSQMDAFADGLMLPVGWFEMSLEDKTLPPDMVNIIFQTTFTVQSIELMLKYGCLLTAMVTAVAFSLVVRRAWHQRTRTDSMRPLRSLQRQDPEQ